MGKIKLEDLKLGTKLYMVSYYQPNKIQDLEVTGIMKIEYMRSLQHRVYYNNTDKFFHFEDIKKRVFFVKEKAEAFLERNRQASIRHNAAQDRIKAKMSKLSDEDHGHLIGRKVLIYDGKGKWAKSEIKRVYVSYANNPKLEFVDSLRGNCWRLDKEGKNWKFWSELDELKLKREEMDKKIAELEGTK